jgi:hypothetical protein
MTAAGAGNQEIKIKMKIRIRKRIRSKIKRTSKIGHPAHLRVCHCSSEWTDRILIFLFLLLLILFLLLIFLFLFLFFAGAIGSPLIAAAPGP